MRNTAVLLTALLALTASAADRPEPLTPQQRDELQKKAEAFYKDGVRLYQQKDLAGAKKSLRQAVDALRTLYPREQYPDGHRDLATCLQWLGSACKDAGEYAEAVPFYQESLAMRRAEFPRERFPRGHERLALALNNLASLHQDAGEYDRAEPLFGETLEMCRALYPRAEFPRGHRNLALALNNLASLHQDAGEFDRAEPLYKEALAMRRALYPKDEFPQGHPDLAVSLNNLATMQLEAGDFARAEPLFREALAMRRALFPREKYPQGHPDLANALNGLAILHQHAGEYGEAEPLLKESLAMCRGLYAAPQFPRGHAMLAHSLSNLASLYLVAGEHARAEPLYKDALAVLRTLYPRDGFPRGHPELARGLNNLARLYEFTSDYARAESLQREALDIRRTLFPRERFPQGHPDLARSLTGLARLHQAAGEYGKAEPLFKEALAMCRALFPAEKYPQGQPDVARGLNNLAGLYLDAGDYDRAESLFKEAVAMRRALYPPERYPHGHADLAADLHNLAAVYHDRGEPARAEPLDRESVGMCRELLLHFAALAAEAECLNYLSTQPLARDAYLAVTRQAAAGPVYDVLWDSRAALTRLQERRHRDLVAGRDREAAELADRLRLARQALARRLLRPLRDAERQRADVQTLTDAKEDLEKRLARKLNLVPLAPVAPVTARRLAERLPERAAFVDLYRYTYFEQDPRIKGKKGERRVDRYAAFVLRHGRPVARVELGEAAAIERAWATWREAITATRPDEPAERRAAAALGRLVWEPMRKALPAAVTTVYLAPDGVLHQVPWAALPGGKPDTVLLDECAVCLVPHGPFLLERLDEAPGGPAPGGPLLALGGVDYDGAPAPAATTGSDVALRGAVLGETARWPALPGTEAERRQVAELTRRVGRLEVVERLGKAASTDQLQRDLPAVRYTHIATHGFFSDPRLRSALQLDPKEFEQTTLDRRGGARSPLAMSGLVLAGANRTGKDMAEDRGIITAEALIGLRLEGMDLAVLSACETGLGAWGGGEGVYGLQRAFHVAGCKNVIASLWKVDDAATQALMALFYRNLWERKLDAAEALRQAQLTLYRHPEAVGVAKKRGIDFTETDLPKVDEQPAVRPGHAPTAHWAAFTFSGVRPAEAKSAAGR
jgi:CHAT domain-containing protein